MCVSSLSVKGLDELVSYFLLAAFLFCSRYVIHLDATVFQYICFICFSR